MTETVETKRLGWHWRLFALFCFRNDPVSRIVTSVVYRYRCPATPVGKSARACVGSGECGCDNADRYPRLTEDKGPR